MAGRGVLTGWSRMLGAGRRAPSRGPGADPVAGRRASPVWWRVAAEALPYPLLLVAGTLLWRDRPPEARARWSRYASTDLVNLADHPVRSLAASAVLCERDLLGWTVLAVLGLAAVGRRFGAGRGLLLASAVHVLATSVSQGLVAYRIGTGALPASARVTTDVGPSYLVVAALVAAIGYGTRGGRVVGALGFGVLAPSLFTGLTDLDLAAVGHLAAVVSALALGWVLTRAVSWWPSADSNRGP